VYYVVNLHDEKLDAKYLTIIKIEKDVTIIIIPD
jgi:hypothetical protein